MRRVVNGTLEITSEGLKKVGNRRKTETILTKQLKRTARILSRFLGDLKRLVDAQTLMKVRLLTLVKKKLTIIIIIIIIMDRDRKLKKL